MSFLYPVWISLLNIVKKWAVRTKLSLVPFHCFLFFPESVKETTRTNIMQIFWSSELLKYYNKKGQVIRLFSLFLVPYICFLFESLKLMRQFSSSFDKICRCSKLLKYFNKTGQILRRFSLFLVLYIRFLFESPKLISFLQDSIRFLDAQNCWSISAKRGRSWDAFYCFLFHLFVSHLSLWN